MKYPATSCRESEQSQRHSCVSRNPDHCKALDSHFRGNDRKESCSKLQGINKLKVEAKKMLYERRLNHGTHQ